MSQSNICLGQGSATCGSRATCGSLDVKLRLFGCEVAALQFHTQILFILYKKKKIKIKIVLNRLTRIRHRFYLSAICTRFSLHPSPMTRIVTVVSPRASKIQSGLDGVVLFHMQFRRPSNLSHLPQKTAHNKKSNLERRFTKKTYSICL